MRTSLTLLLFVLVVRLAAAEEAPSELSPDFVDLVIPTGWNALLNPENKTGIIIGEYQTPATAHTKMKLVTQPTLSSLAKTIEDLGYKPVILRSATPSVEPPGPSVSGPLPKPKLSKDFVDMVIPVGWNALLNPEKKTAGVMGEFKTPGKAHTKLFLLSCKSQVELMSVISRLGYKPLFPPAPGTPGGKPISK